jgi:hypothetical protein
MREVDGHFSIPSSVVNFCWAFAISLVYSLHHSVSANHYLSVFERICLVSSYSRHQVGHMTRLLYSIVSPLFHDLGVYIHHSGCSNYFNITTCTCPAYSSIDSPKLRTIMLPTIRMSSKERSTHPAPASLGSGTQLACTFGV